MQKIIPHLWFDKEADEAAQFYLSLFQESKLLNKTVLRGTPSGDADLLTIELAGQEFMLISAGPYFQFTPAISFLIACNSMEEVDVLWEKLYENGDVLMPMDAYPFSQKYGWLRDKYGVNWQIMYTEEETIKQKITPTLMFVGDNLGRAQEAILFYTSVFKNAKIRDILRYPEGAQPDKAGTIQHVEFTLENFDMAAMDSAYDHKFTFNEAISFLVNCDTQEEIDYYWDKLSKDPEAEQCGWLKDQYGVSWQISPAIMKDMLMDGDPKKIAKVTKAFLKMKKFNIEELKKAYEEE